MKDRIYVCHTYYHVYVTFLKELNMPKEKRGQATLVLSRMSNDFETFAERAKASGLFEEVLEYDEKKPEYFEELALLKEDRGNMVLNMISRIRFCKKFAKLQAPFVPVNFKEYKEIYVYCDSDPIGYYLNYNKIYYHALEDGLNCLAYYDTARFDNRGAFDVKVFMSKRLNLIFIQNGYGRYCKDMEVNDISKIKYPCPYYKEVPRQQYVDCLTDEDKQVILKAFVKDYDALVEALEKAEATGKKKVLVLTEPLCDLNTRERIFRDIIRMYGEEAVVVLKPHPRDELDYNALFGEYFRIDRTVPMEMLNFIPGAHFDRLISVLTETAAIQFATEKIKLGPDFMDAYEAPHIHRQNEQI
ncbi:MAG: lipooligosaccharide sialyltransferase [Lachnospiraceae bacterium]|nr:lipooligosaccharide sialyltransferase [Lachnospiraceae bacterium]